MLKNIEVIENRVFHSKGFFEITMKELKEYKLMGIEYLQDLYIKKYHPRLWAA